MLPEVFLLTLCDSTALLVAYLYDVSQDIIELLYMLVRPLLIRESHIEKSVHNVRAQVH